MHYGAKIDALFEMAKQNPNATMNRPGRLMGGNCTAKYERGRAKRAKRNGVRYVPLVEGWKRPVIHSEQMAPKIDGVRYRWARGSGLNAHGELVPRK